MAKELPRIAKSTEQTAFASEESYFALEQISENISTLLGTIQIVALNSFRQDTLMTDEIEETRGIKLSIDGLVVKLDEFIETLKRTALRDSLTGDQTNGGAGDVTPQGPGSAGAQGGDDSNFVVLGGLGFIGKALTLALSAAAGALVAYIKTLQFYGNILAKTFRGLFGVFKSFSSMLVNLIPGFADLFAAVRTRFTSMVAGAFLRLTLLADDISSLFTSFKELSFIQKIRDVFKPVVSVLSNAFDAVKGIFSSVVNTSSRLQGVGRWVGAIAKSVAPLAKLFAKIFYPLGIIITAFDTIKGFIDGFVEDGILGGLEGGITGLFNSLIGAPLDMIKGAAAWILGFFGLDEAKKTLNEFSFSTFFSDIIGSIFDGIKSAVDWIKTLFTDPVSALKSMWNTLVGGASWLIDIVYAPINLALNWIKSLFGWGDPDEEFRLQDFMLNTWVSIKDWFKEKIKMLNPLNWFGGGEDDLQGEIDQTTANIENAQGIQGSVARGRGAAGLDAEGNLVTARSGIEGGADAKLAVQGITPMSQEELSEYIATQEQSRTESQQRLQELQNQPSIGQMVLDGFNAAKAWLVDLFTFDASNGILAGVATKLIDIVYAPVNLAISWVQGLFGWGDPNEPWKISTLVLGAFKAAKDWIVGLFTWGSNPEESFSLIDTAKGAFQAAKDWIVGLFTWGSNPEESFSLIDTAKGAFQAAKDWIVGLFTWGSNPEESFSLIDTAKGAFQAAKDWIVGLFTWNGGSEDGTLDDMIDTAIENVKTFFSDLFDFLPSLGEIKDKLVSFLPSWLRPESQEEERARLQAIITEEQEKIDASNDGDNVYWGREGPGRERSQAKIDEAAARLEELDALQNEISEFDRGGVAKAPETGGLAMLHGTEIIAPLESPQGKLLNIINESFKQSVSPATTTYSTADRSGSMANVMNSTQRTIEDMRTSSTTSTAPVVNNYNVVQGGTNISAPSTSLAIVNPGRRGPASRPDRR